MCSLVPFFLSSWCKDRRSSTWGFLHLFRPNISRVRGEASLVHTLWFFSSFKKGSIIFFPSTLDFLLLLPLHFCFPSFLLQQHWPVSYTPPPTMVLAIYSSSLTVLSSLRFKRDACIWVEGLLFGKEGEGLMHATGWFWGRVKVTLFLSLSLYLYLCLNKVGCLALV